MPRPTHLGRLDASVAVLAGLSRQAAAAGSSSQAVEPAHVYARTLWIDLAAGPGSGDEAGTVVDPLRSFDAAIARMGVPTSQADFESPWTLYVSDGVGSAAQDRPLVEFPARRVVIIAPGAQLPHMAMTILDDHMFGSVIPAGFYISGAPGSGVDTATDVPKAQHAGMCRVGNNFDGTHRAVSGVKQGVAEVVPGDGGFAATRKFEVVLENVWLQGQVRWLSGSFDDVAAEEATLVMRSCHWQSPQLYGHSSNAPALPVSDGGTYRCWTLKMEGCTVLGPGVLLAWAIPSVVNTTFAQLVSVSSKKRSVSGVDILAGTGFVGCNLSDTTFYADTTPGGDDVGVYQLDAPTLYSLVVGGADLSTNVDGKAFHLPGVPKETFILYHADGANTFPLGGTLYKEQRLAAFGYPFWTDVAPGVAPHALIRSLTLLYDGVPDNSERLTLNGITTEADVQLYLASGDAFQIPTVDGHQRRDVMWRCDAALGFDVHVMGGPINSGTAAIYLAIEIIQFDNPRAND